MAVVIPPGVATGDDGQFLSHDPNDPALNSKAGIGGDVWGAFGGGYIPEQFASRGQLVQASGGIAELRTPIVTDPNGMPVKVGLSNGSVSGNSIAPVILTINTPGAVSITMPGGWTRAVAVVQGAGGGGGGSSTISGGPSGGGAGGGGEQRTKTYTAGQLPAVVAAVIGTGGLGGLGDPNNGTVGGATTFNGADVTANGGVPGFAFANGSGGGTGGTGGSGGTGINGGIGGGGRQSVQGDPGQSIGGTSGGGGGGGSTTDGPAQAGGIVPGVTAGVAGATASGANQTLNAGNGVLGGGGAGACDKGFANCAVNAGNGGTGKPGNGGGGAGGGAKTGAGSTGSNANGGNGGPGQIILTISFT